MRKIKNIYVLLSALLLLIILLSQSANIFNLFSGKTPLSRYTFSQAFYADDGTLLRLTLSHDDKYRLFVPYKDIPADMRHALMMYEDKWYYLHYGVNPLALARSFFTTYIKKSRRMGASTITMQTARMVYNLDTTLIPGKIKQIFCALWLEFRYTKKQILETYFNLAPYSYNIEGVGAASLIYFGTRVQDSTLLQTLTLTVIPQNPNKRNPALKNGFANMQAARNKLFNKWIKKYPQDKKLESFFNMPMAVKTPATLPFLVPHVINYLLQREHTPEVFTTINLPTQQLLENDVKLFISRSKAHGLKNASVVLLNYKTMQVEAAVGSADFWNDEIAGQVNGFAAQRLAGSTLKTYIYAQALEQGIIHPATLLKDTKKSFGIYSPENSDRMFAGPILAADALTRSRNIPAIELLRQTGYDNFVNTLRDGGVKGLKNGNYYSTGLALGTFEISPLELSALYAALANKGEYREPKFTKTAPPSKPKQLLTPEAAFIALDMLKNNTRPYKKLRLSVSKDFPVYFKTGTSSSYKDAWTAGVFEDYALVVWAGNFSGEGNNYFLGRQAALPLFFDIVKTVEKNKPGFNYRPLSADGLKITQVDVCKGTGDLPGKYCPATFKSYFIPGVSPIKVSDIHREILIDKATGLRACRYDPVTTKAEVYEFWPSEIETLFKEAGIIRRAVPRYLSGCTIEEAAASGNAPEILLPTKDVIYTYKDNESDKPIIPLKADLDADAGKVFWFVGGQFMGESKENQTLFIKPKSGTFTVKAVDDMGRSAQSMVTISVSADIN
ncbi:penicillin-binding protein 1C [Elusimicrobium simillimum]|uniref:penicillin-binding protein 1C n=1 Tax=Elusimicrobium simillimum TaxID=3143438 RepID=UPI003C701B3F